MRVIDVKMAASMRRNSPGRYHRSGVLSLRRLRPNGACSLVKAAAMLLASCAGGGPSPLLMVESLSRPETIDGTVCTNLGPVPLWLRHLVLRHRAQPAKGFHGCVVGDMEPEFRAGGPIRYKLEGSTMCPGNRSAQRQAKPSPSVLG